jgi:hypothetical protein
MPASKRNFIIGVSLILACIIAVGCLPNKQGGFSCVCAPLLAKLKSGMSTLQTKPKQNATQTQTTTVPIQAQPQDFKVEEAKINDVIGKLCSAFKAKDLEEALKYIQAEERDKYRKVFSQSPDVLPKLAADLEKAKINFLSFESIAQCRTAEYSIEADGQSFSVVFIMIDGQWMLKAL